MNCTYPGCTNAARYVNDSGLLCCGICPLKVGADSIRLVDVPGLVALARDFVKTSQDGVVFSSIQGQYLVAAKAWFDMQDQAKQMREILGRKP